MVLQYFFCSTLSAGGARTSLRACVPHDMKYGVRNGSCVLASAAAAVGMICATRRCIYAYTRRLRWSGGVRGGGGRPGRHRSSVLSARKRVRRRAGRWRGGPADRRWQPCECMCIWYARRLSRSFYSLPCCSHYRSRNHVGIIIIIVIICYTTMTTTKIILYSRVEYRNKGRCTTLSNLLCTFFDNKFY